ncbi:MAG TPA: type II toxin-antitoxin system HicB family antitoxin [Anaerolineae bacterium]|nr:type II toxin-antitoxin system HicB family antitoxin [Anaerolineae bacterium]
MSERILSINIEPLEEGGYLATSDDLQGLIAQGRTMAEAMEIAQDVARKLIESYLEHGDPLPPKIAALLSQPRRRTEVKIPVGIVPEAVAA